MSLEKLAVSVIVGSVKQELENCLLVYSCFHATVAKMSSYIGGGKSGKA
jgi:hypothetical protein